MRDIGSNDSVKMPHQGGKLRSPRVAANATAGAQTLLNDPENPEIASHDLAEGSLAGRAQSSAQDTATFSVFCPIQCKRLAEALRDLEIKEAALNHMLTGDSYEDALHNAWLSRKACEQAGHAVMKVLSAGSACRVSGCTALREYRMTVDELGFCFPGIGAPVL